MNIFLMHESKTNKNPQPYDQVSKIDSVTPQDDVCLKKRNPCLTPVVNLL